VWGGAGLELCFLKFPGIRPALYKTKKTLTYLIPHTHYLRRSSFSLLSSPRTLRAFRLFIFSSVLGPLFIFFNLPHSCLPWAKSPIPNKTLTQGWNPESPVPQLPLTGSPPLVWSSLLLKSWVPLHHPPLSSSRPFEFLGTIYLSLSPWPRWISCISFTFRSSLSTFMFLFCRGIWD
jgi:hypothetical protein